jgi:phosphoenolpyruvate-protein phosphotransferase (PTS system enzyme I)
MKPAMRFMTRITQRNPSAICLTIALVTLAVDFATGRDIRFPLLYLLPIGLASWMGKKILAYALSALLPLLRVYFEIYWRVPELLPIESLNAAIEVIALSFYVSLVGRKASETRKMEKAITIKDEEMLHLRAFTRLVGTTLQGRGISPGLSDGVAVIYQPEQESALSEPGISPDEVQSEGDRFDRAVAASIHELNSIREHFEGQQTDHEIALIEMRLAMLKDPFFLKNCKRRVSENMVTIEHAVMAEIQGVERLLNESKQGLMRERSADVRDLGHQILRNLRTSGMEDSNRLAALPPGTILVAEELLLSDALQIDPANVAAIVTEKTGPASHVAILARTRHIPAVCNIKDATSLLFPGDHLLVDAEAGTVTVGPTQWQAARFAARKTQSVLFATVPAQEPIQPCITKDGVEIGLHANIGRPDEAGLVLEHRLDGVGLFRSEFLFLEAEQPPDLETQIADYSEVATMLDPRPVIIRTMDLGGDKMPRFNWIANNKALPVHLRGLAYSLSEKTMFCTQIRAILRAAQRGNVKIMFPMVMGVADLSEARRFVDEVFEKEHLSKRPPLGAMIETPAAAFDIQGILQIADFVCIGTNDLANSFLAVDRGLPGHPEVHSFLHPSVLRATEQIIRAAVNQGVGVSVCGEAASDPVVACLLIGMGVKDLSMNPFLTAKVRQAIRQVTLDQAQALAKTALSATTPQEIQEIVASTSYKTAA